MSQIVIAVYDRASGRIARRISCHATVPQRVLISEAMLQVPRGTPFDDESHYVDLTGPLPALTWRPEAPAVSLSATEVVADGEAEILLTNVPAGATVTIGATSIVADGDDIAITTDLPGINRVTVDSFPAQLWTETFLGTAP